MIEIIPAILPKDYEELKDKLSLLCGVAPVAQIDICDGKFVKNTTWPFSTKPARTGGAEKGTTLDEHFRWIMNEEEGMPFWEDIDFELDLMVMDAAENFDLYIKLGARRVVFHVEAMKDTGELRNFLEGIDIYIRDTIEIGIAFNPDFQVENIFPLLASVDFVQVMGINRIGFQGEDLDQRVLGHIRALKEKFFDLVVSVDGGVNLKTAPDLIAAGADRLVIGSALFSQNDIMEAITEFKKLSDAHR
jgi:ribulose-phosphate 3-epimerase